MSYCLWAMGFSSEKMIRVCAKDSSWEIAGKWKVRRNEIHKYFTDDFWHNLSLYHTFKSCGLPWNMGWAEHPKDIIHLIQIFDQAEVLYQNSQVKDGNS